MKSWTVGRIHLSRRLGSICDHRGSHMSSPGRPPTLTHGGRVGTPPPFEKPKGRTGAEHGQGGPAGRAGACRLASVFSEEDWRGGLQGRTGLSGLFIRQCLPSERPQETAERGCQKKHGMPITFEFQMKNKSVFTISMSHACTCHPCPR